MSYLTNRLPNCCFGGTFCQCFSAQQGCGSHFGRPANEMLQSDSGAESLPDTGELSLGAEPRRHRSDFIDHRNNIGLGSFC